MENEKVITIEMKQMQNEGGAKLKPGNERSRKVGAENGGRNGNREQKIGVENGNRVGIEK